MRLECKKAKKTPFVTEPAQKLFFSCYRTIMSKNSSLTTEFREIIEIIRVHKVFLSQLFGYYSVPCFIFDNHDVFSVLSVVNAFLKLIIFS